jgi:hypothetical protein
LQRGSTNDESQQLAAGIGHRRRVVYCYALGEINQEGSYAATASILGDPMRLQGHEPMSHSHVVERCVRDSQRPIAARGFDFLLNANRPNRYSEVSRWAAATSVIAGIYASRVNFYRTISSTGSSRAANRVGMPWPEWELKRVLSQRLTFSTASTLSGACWVGHGLTPIGVSAVLKHCASIDANGTITSKTGPRRRSTIGPLTVLMRFGPLRVDLMMAL